MASRVIGESDRRFGYQRAWKTRIENSDRIARGEFKVKLPDGTTLTEAPKIANYVDLKLHSAADTASNIIPSIRCPDPTGTKRARAEKRERIHSYYFNECAKGPNMLSRYFIDWMMTGATFKLVTPDFDSGFPKIERLDPRDVWPDTVYSPDKPVCSVLTSCQVPLEALAYSYPEKRAELFSAYSEGGRKVAPSELVKVLGWYDKSEWVRVAVTKNSRGQSQGVVLSRVSSRISRLPIAVGARDSFDGEFRGIFDQALSRMEADNNYENILLDAAIDWAYPSKTVWGIENPEDVGTGALLRAERQDAYLRMESPAHANPQLFGLLQSGKNETREAVTYPAARSGDPGISSGSFSAAGVNSLQGDYNGSVAAMQRAEARAWSDALSIAAEIDEKYLDDKKQIAGGTGATSWSLTYAPSEDVKGDYKVDVGYGAASGSDQFNFDIRVIQALGSGLLDQETAMELHSMVQDVNEVMRRRVRTSIFNAGLAFVQAKASNPEAPDLAPALAFNQALKDPKTDYADVVEMLGSIYQGQAPGQQQTGQEAFSDAAAVARGGLGNGPVTVPGVGAQPTVGASARTIAANRGGEQLPSLSSILVQ